MVFNRLSKHEWVCKCFDLFGRLVGTGAGRTRDAAKDDVRKAAAEYQDRVRALNKRASDAQSGPKWGDGMASPGDICFA
jgi:hypothetical protein